MSLPKEHFYSLWNSRVRGIPVDLAWIHAMHESQVEPYAYNPETAYNERHGLSGNEQVHAYGMFQMLNVNFQNFDVWQNQDCVIFDDFILWQMDEYDSFASPMYSRYELREFFGRYNGGGPNSQYAIDIEQEYLYYIGDAEELPEEPYPLWKGLVFVVLLLLAITLPGLLEGREGK